jgi:ABC-type Fe3+ transport system permease subunit/DNA-binding beta-propeller fold protein YncE
VNWTLLQNSLLVAGATALLAAAIGFSVALFSSCLSRRSQRIVLVLGIIALLMPPFVVTNCWLDLLGANSVLRQWIPLNIFSLPGAVLILTLLTWPLPFLLIRGAWQQIEPAQLEAEPALRGLALLRWLLWPLAKTSCALGLVLAFVLALNNFAVPTILQVKVLPATVWVAFNTSLDAIAAAKASWPMVLMPVVVLLAARTGRVEWPREQGTAAALHLRRQLGPPLLTAAAVITAIVLFLSVAIPLLQLAASSRTWSEFVPALSAGTNALVNSALYAVAAAVLCGIIGLALWRFRAGALLWLAFFVPGVLLGIALITYFNKPSLGWFFQSAFVVIAAFALRYAALAWHASRQAMCGADRNLVDALRIEGASGLKLFRHAYWPQIAPQVAFAAYAVYLLSLWDVETIITIVPPGGETLALRIFNLLHYGHNSHVNTLCVLLLLLGLAPLAIAAIGRVLFARRVAPVAALFCAALVLSGCSNAPSRATTAVESKLFSSVEIIGERGTSAGQFNKPRCVTVDRSDNLFVADMTGRIQKFSPSGEFLLSWEMPQTDLGKPKGLSCDVDGNIVVLEPHYQRVNIFTPDGKLVRQWGHRGTNAGGFVLPRDIAINSKGEALVPEYMDSERVQKFSPRGELLGVIGKPGLGHGEFNRAEGVGVDASNRVYVADSCNHRIQIFSADGKFLRAHGKSGVGVGEFAYPYDICIDREGRQFVCEFGNSRIQVFDANDRPLEIIGHGGAGPGEFANPWGIALDSKGNLYVADSQNHRVQKLVRATKS